MSRLLAAGGGFLLAVLWMDLMFDVQALHLGNDPARDAEILRSIGAYYRRVTTEASPMNRLIGGVMLVTVAASVTAAIRARGRRTVPIVGALLVGVSVALALGRVFPDAIRLGAGIAPPEGQVELAQVILRNHLLCLAAIAAFTALQLRTARSPGDPEA